MKSHADMFLMTVMVFTFCCLFPLNAQHEGENVEAPRVSGNVTGAVQQKAATEQLTETEKGEDQGSKPKTFELDRGDDTQAVSAQPAEAQTKRSFWGRLFGRKSAETEEGAGEKETTTTTTPSAEFAKEQASEAAGTLKAESKILKREEILALHEEVRRQAAEIEALKNLDQAYQAMRQNKFEVALGHFNAALTVMPKRPQTAEIRQKARFNEAECEYRIALNFYWQGQIQEAKDATRRALSYYPAHRKSTRLNNRIKRIEEKKLVRALKPVPPDMTATYLDKQAKISAALKLGRQYMEIDEYEKAKYEFRRVLTEDALNADATANLKKIAETEYKRDTAQMDRMRAEMLAQVRDTWTPPIRQEITAPKVKLAEGLELGPSRRRLLKKLNSIVIPELDLVQANIIYVIKYLTQQSYAADTDSPPDQRGVNIILNLKRPGEITEVTALTQPAAGEEVFGVTEEAAVPSDVPLITLHLRNIVLKEAIRYIADVAGLKYRVEENAVLIMPADVVYGQVITRTYKVQPTITEVIMGGGAAGAEVGGELELDFGAGADVERADVKTFFENAGVPFPEGTSIVYKPSINLLIVSNTAENLERFERILAMLNVIPTQVEIEARFVEIGQRDLEELGVEWSLTDDWEIAQDASASAAVPLSARERLQVNKNAMSKGLRYLSMASGVAAPVAGGDMGGIFSISSVLTNPELTFVLHALQQMSGVNLLSAPKVTTKSGSNAEIKVVKELIYPTEFENVPPEVSSGDAGIITPGYVTPASFETRDLGVVLNVTPTVGPDGYTIDLVMMPQVVELADWINYGSIVVNPQTGEIEQMNMPQPIFHSRSIATSISIWDGQTVVMGGLITEGQSTSEDKIPFLGDIPLLGYLFRSKSTKTEKRNLLIFVTAHLVDPAGNRINKSLGEGTLSQSSAAVQ